GGRGLVGGRRVGAALAGGRRRGLAGLALLGEGGGGGVVDGAQLGQAVGGRRLGDVGRALGDEGDRVALAVLPEADVAEVPPDQRRLVVGGLDVLPLGDDELGVLAVAVVLALGPGLAVDGERVVVELDARAVQVDAERRVLARAAGAVGVDVDDAVGVGVDADGAL